MVRRKQGLVHTVCGTPVIEGELGKLRKAAETHINNAMRNRRPGQIAAALDEAKRARLHNPSRLEKARALQAELKAGGKR